MKHWKKGLLVLTCSLSLNVAANEYAEFQNDYKPSFEMNQKFETGLNPDGTIKPSSFIVNGEEASLSEFPFYARLILTNYQDKYGHICGGSIINNQYILTAAHCVYEPDLNSRGATYENLGVVINNSSFSSLYLDEIKPVEAVFVHPNYNPATITDDIAVIKLKNKISEHFTPISLPTNEDRLTYDQKAFYHVTGMGYVNDYNEFPNELRTTKVQAESDSMCQSLVSSYYGASYDYNKQACVVPIDENGSCQGDSGGPLTYVDDNGKQQQLALVSYGSSRGCAINNVPSVYTEVLAYVPWIKEVMGEVTDKDKEPVDNNESSGGSLGLFSLAGLMGFAAIRRKKQK